MLGQELLNGDNLTVDKPNQDRLRVKDKSIHIEAIAVDERANADTGREVARQLTR